MSRSLIPDLSALHAKVCGGDSAALDQLVGNVLGYIPATLERKFPYAAPDVVRDGVVDAVLEYSRRPDSFDPSHGLTLDRFIFLASARNLSNLLRSEKRRRSREIKYAVETFNRLRTHAHVSDPHAANLLRARILNLVSPGAERRALLAWLDGMGTVDLARHLDLSSLPPAEQGREVKRFRDRVRRRVVRHFMATASIGYASRSEMMRSRAPGWRGM